MLGGLIGQLGPERFYNEVLKYLNHVRIGTVTLPLVSVSIPNRYALKLGFQPSPVAQVWSTNTDLRFGDGSLTSSGTLSDIF